MQEGRRQRRGPEGEGFGSGGQNPSPAQAGLRRRGDLPPSQALSSLLTPGPPSRVRRAMPGLTPLLITAEESGSENCQREGVLGDSILAGMSQSRESEHQEAWTSVSRFSWATGHGARGLPHVYARHLVSSDCTSVDPEATMSPYYREGKVRQRGWEQPASHDTASWWQVGFEPGQSDICGHTLYQKQGLLIAVLPKFEAQSFIHLPV